MIPIEVLQLLERLTPFAIVALVALVALWRLPPMFEKRAAANDRLAAAFITLSETLTGVQKATTASEHAIGELAITVSDTNAPQITALNKIVENLNYVARRQLQSMSLTKETKDLGVQTLAKANEINNTLRVTDEVVGGILGTVLDMKDLLEAFLEHSQGDDATDVEPLEKRLERFTHQVLEAIEKKNEAQLIPVDALAFEDHKDADGQIRTTIVTSGAPPADNVAGETTTDQLKNQEKPS